MKRLLAWGGLLVVLSWMGCKSPQGPASDSLACVEIQGRSAVQIAGAIDDVFREASYSPVRPVANHKMTLMFEKQGSTGDMLVYGDWSGKKLWYRAKLNIKSLDGGGQLVECDAYRVSEHGDPRFEEETKLSRLKKKPYQELLDEVKARLNGLAGR